MINIFTLIDAIALVLVYLLVANRLFRIGERFRNKAIDSGAALLSDNRVPNEIKEIVEEVLPSATSAVVAWCFALGVIPAVLISAFQQLRGAPRPDWLPRSHVSYWREWDDFGDYFMASALCNSPIAAVLFVTQIVLLSFFVMPHMIIGRLIKGAAAHHKRGGILQDHKPA
ncbi:MAG TPA: hypothetical protein VFC54_05075 [Pseudolabrys sp.]|nr:hypothetical protein [Pseudolabrys sp.]